MTPIEQMKDQLLAGFVNIKIDVMTVIVVVLGVFLILVALDLFKDFFVGRVDSFRSRSDEREAERLLSLKRDPSTSQFYHDVIDKKYRAIVNRRSQRKF